MVLIDQLLIAVSVLLLLAVLASKASSRVGVPSLLLFLLIGTLAGSEGPGGIPFDDAHLAQALGIVALAFILFAGGLDTNWESVSDVRWEALSLSTAGVLRYSRLGWLVRYHRARFVVASRAAPGIHRLFDRRGCRLCHSPIPASQPQKPYEAAAGVGIGQQ